MTLTQCDRCKSELAPAGVWTHVLFGHNYYDFCSSCLEDFASWVKDGVINTEVKSVNASQVPLVDCDAEPSLPSWASKIVEHKKCGTVDPSTISFFQTEAMKTGGYTREKDLVTETEKAGLQAANATLLQWLELHQEYVKDVPAEIQVLICTESEFLSGSGRSYFVCLCRNGGRWRLGSYWTDDEFDGECAVLVSASKSSVA